MNSSVETRYPFLDEEVFKFLARIHPRWKLRGFREKYILRLLGERYLPHEVAWRPKGMFRAPLDSFFDHQVPAYVDQLLSDESLKKTGYFNVEAVRHCARPGPQSPGRPATRNRRSNWAWSAWSRRSSGIRPFIDSSLAGSFRSLTGQANREIASRSYRMRRSWLRQGDRSMRSLIFLGGFALLALALSPSSDAADGKSR